MSTKLCVDCKHMQGGRGGHWCMAPIPGEVNRVYGGPVPVRTLCFSARSPCGACGLNGKLFEAKPPKRSFWGWLFRDTLGGWD